MTHREYQNIKTLYRQQYRCRNRFFIKAHITRDNIKSAHMSGDTKCIMLGIATLYRKYTNCLNRDLDGLYIEISYKFNYQNFYKR